MISIAALGLAKTAAGWLAGNWKLAVPAAAFIALGAWSVDRTIRVANLRAEIARGEAKAGAQRVLGQQGTQEGDHARFLWIDSAFRQAKVFGPATPIESSIGRDLIVP